MGLPSRSVRLLSDGAADGSAASSRQLGVQPGRLIGISVHYTNAPAGTTLLITTKAHSESSANKTLFSITGNTDVVCADVVADPVSSGNVEITTRNTIHPTVGGQINIAVGSADHNTEIDLTLQFEL